MVAYNTNVLLDLLGPVAGNKAPNSSLNSIVFAELERQKFPEPEELDLGKNSLSFELIFNHSKIARSEPKLHKN